MPTVTLLDNAGEAGQMQRMTAQPGGIELLGLTGQNAVFHCTNQLTTIHNATTVDDIYDAPHNPPQQTFPVSSVHA
jgi:hypothetical protein